MPHADVMNPFYSMASDKVRRRWLEWEGNQDENADLITAPWKSDHASGLSDGAEPVIKRMARQKRS
jgi:hypothetical protein